jgi:CRP-like cAMP-binding protein
MRSPGHSHANHVMIPWCNQCSASCWQWVCLPADSAVLRLLLSFVYLVPPPGSPSTDAGPGTLLNLAELLLPSPAPVTSRIAAITPCTLWAIDRSKIQVGSRMCSWPVGLGLAAATTAAGVLLAAVVASIAARYRVSSLLVLRKSTHLPTHRTTAVLRLLHLQALAAERPELVLELGLIMSRTMSDQLQDLSATLAVRSTGLAMHSCCQGGQQAWPWFPCCPLDLHGMTTCCTGYRDRTMEAEQAPSDACTRLPTAMSLASCRLLNGCPPSMTVF